MVIINYNYSWSMQELENFRNSLNKDLIIEINALRVTKLDYKNSIKDLEIKYNFNF